MFRAHYFLLSGRTLSKAVLTLLRLESWVRSREQGMHSVHLGSKTVTETKEATQKFKILGAKSGNNVLRQDV